jgi:hypothetical protein
VLRESVLLFRICGTQDKLVSSVDHAPISCFTLGCMSVTEIRSVYHICEEISHFAVCIKPDLAMLLAGEALNNTLRTIHLHVLMSAFNVATAAFLTYACYDLTAGYQEYVSRIVIETIIMIINF